MRHRAIAALALAFALIALACGDDATRGDGSTGRTRPPRPIALAIPHEWPFPPESAPIATGDGGIVASTDRVASEVGAEVLRNGGNAVDAAVAVAFALAVVCPEAGNLGGGGFAVVGIGDQTLTLDFRETAPAAATRNMFLDDRGETGDRSRVGHLASGVPGSVAGLEALHEKLGTKEWRALLAPAIALADGLVVHERLARSLASNAERLNRFPATAAAFLPGGRPPVVGERLAQPDLAAALRRIAESGSSGFYRGRTAELIVAEMQRGGGIITAEDLTAYEPKWREPVTAQYRGHRIVTMGPPSSGGTTLAGMLAMMEPHDVRGLGFHSAAHVHLFAEASRRAFADRNAVLGDPDFSPAPVAALIDRAYLRRRAGEIDLQRATKSAAVRPYAPPRNEGTNTTHVSIVDAAGGAVALTTTINDLYGSLVVVQGAGFFLNNEMDDFTTRPGQPNSYGLVQGEANAVGPRKRMLSSMTPAIVMRGDRVRMVVGSPGGPRIITSVAQVISNVIDFGMTPAEAVAAPRVHHQHLPDHIRMERNALDESVIAELQRMGHAFEVTDVWSDVQLIEIREGGRRIAASDPRRGGAPAAVRVEEPR